MILIGLFSSVIFIIKKRIKFQNAKLECNHFYNKRAEQMLRSLMHLEAIQLFHWLGHRKMILSQVNLKDRMHMNMKILECKTKETFIIITRLDINSVRMIKTIVFLMGTISMGTIQSIDLKEKEGMGTITLNSKTEVWKE